MHYFKLCVLTLFLVLPAFPAVSEVSCAAVPGDMVNMVVKKDSVKTSSHSPTVAMLLSIIPGGGQVYNKKYWKVPIVYACLGASAYCIYYTGREMSAYRNEYKNRKNGAVSVLNPDLASIPDENLIKQKNQYLRYMEISIGVTAILYVLNMIDAVVDAHLYDFNISDDLSLSVSPALMNNQLARSSLPAYGVSLSFNW